MTVLLLLSCMLLGAALPLFAAYPKNDDGIADEAGVLSEATIRTIKQENQGLSKDLGVSIAVCTVKTTGNTSIDEYARGLFKNWKLGEGVLLLIATEDKDYYFVPSAGTERVLTAQVLTAVRDGYLEEDFAAGNIDRGVLKTVSRLSSLLVSGMQQLAQESETQENENEGTSVGAFIAGLFKLLLWIVLILIVAFVIFFVVAMFNDDAAAILRKYVFRKNKPQVAPYAYDERLYGTPGRRPDPQTGRRPAQSGQVPRRRPGANGYPTQNIQRIPPSNQGQPIYYNADGTPRRQNAPQRNRAPQNNRTPRRDDTFGDETRQFTIPTRYDR